MKYSFLFFSFFILISDLVYSQVPVEGMGYSSQIQRLERTFNHQVDELPYDKDLAPFYHGVASGDPLSDRVIIWTRVTPDTDLDTLKVKWFMALDEQFNNIVAQGETSTFESRDFTVKVDVEGLSQATTYYYIFSYNGKNSVTGRTRTSPEANGVQQLRFAVVSCNNYQAGYFNAFARIAERKDLDAVIHLGDYIYEYGAGEGTYGFDSSRLERSNIPGTEIIDLMDYRTRYSLYRLDKDLQAVHQQHPFIVVWDDHESANDSYADGAENHNDGEGSWEERKSISKQVWFEWLPVREVTGQQSIYRKFSYGNLADIIMLDTRLEGREKQPANAIDTATFKTLLGKEQKKWLKEELKNSSAKWKILGNQVIFSQLNVGFAAVDSSGNPAPTDKNAIIGVESIFVDIWDGYPKEREEIISYIDSGNIENVIILTGDFHSTFAFDVTQNPVIYPNPMANNLPTPSPSYDPLTGKGSVAVEFASPSITSANFDENVSAELATQFELSFNNPIQLLGDVVYNPHMKYVDLDQHGYFLLDINDTTAQADWYFVNILDKTDKNEKFGQGWKTLDMKNHLVQADTSSTGKKVQPALAPKEILSKDFTTSLYEINQEFVLFNAYPNPVASGGELLVNLSFLKKFENVAIDLFSLEGKQAVRLTDKDFRPGNYTLSLGLPDLAPGIYQLRIQVPDGGVRTKQIIVR